MLIKIIVVITTLIGILLIVASQRPDIFVTSVSTVIGAPAEKIFPHINNLRAWDAWSPFEKGVQMKRTYEGPEAGAGAKVIFDGNQSGTGVSSIVASTPNSRIEMKLVMTKPLACDNDVTFTLLPAGDATTVTWRMSGPTTLLTKLMGMLFSEKMVRNQFAAGLHNLKEVVENGQKNLHP